MKTTTKMKMRTKITDTHAKRTVIFTVNPMYVCVCVSGQLIKAVDDFEKSLLLALDQFIVVLHSDMRKASVSVETLLRVGRQQRSTVNAKVCLVSHHVCARAIQQSFCDMFSTSIASLFDSVY